MIWERRQVDRICVVMQDSTIQRYVAESDSVHTKLKKERWKALGKGKPAADSNKKACVGERGEEENVRNEQMTLFKFTPGFTNAVKRTVRISEFLP